MPISILPTEEPLGNPVAQAVPAPLSRLSRSRLRCVECKARLAKRYFRFSTPIGYLDSDRFVGFMMIKRSALLKDKSLGTVLPHLRLNTRAARCGLDPFPPPNVRDGTR